MEFVFPDEFVLFDLEFTSWEGAVERDWSGPNEYREIIQIGAIRVAGTDFSETASFVVYVRPVKNPRLSDFIIELTGIMQKDIDTRGVLFADAMRDFLRFVGDTPAYCWGSDADIIRENARLYGVPLHLPEQQFINLRPLTAVDFSAQGINIGGYSSGTLLQAFGLPQKRRAHDAINDMRNLADALRELRLR